MPKTIINKAKVLIIDDEQSNVRLLERLLELVGGVHFKSTCDSRQAVDLFHEFHPDLIILDLHMPHLDGFGVLEQLKGVIPHESYLPVLVLTADVTAETKRKALSAGAKDFLTKPLDHSEVLLRIKNLLETRFLHLQLQSQNMLLEEHVQERTQQLEETLTQLRTTQHQLVKQERLRALGTMAGGIAHDFNNALTMILGYSELLMGRCQSHCDAEEIEFLNTIITAAQDSTRIVGRLREFYRPSEENDVRMAIHLNQLVQHAISLTLPKWKDQAMAQGVQIHIETDFNDLPQLAGDPAELREVLTNLIFNAVDAMPKGGTLKLSTRMENERAILKVSDTGMGMSEEVRLRCLEPFFTSKGEQGTGLGLSVVYGIIQRHEGEIQIESEPDKGSTFTISLPVNGPTQAVNFETPQPLEQILRILVVDDQPIICQLLAEYLTDDGHTVEIAHEGTSALEKFRAGEFDLVITDEAMPGMSGEQLAAAIKEYSPPKPVILLTGFGDMMDRSLRDIDMVVSKPVTLSELRKSIMQVMAKSAETLAMAIQVA